MNWGLPGSSVHGIFQARVLEWVAIALSVLGTSELKWTEMGEFSSDDHYIYYCEQESLRRNEVAFIVNEKVKNAMQSQK